MISRRNLLKAIGGAVSALAVATHLTPKEEVPELVCGTDFGDPRGDFTDVTYVYDGQETVWVHVHGEYYRGEPVFKRFLSNHPYPPFTPVVFDGVRNGWVTVRAAVVGEPSIGVVVCGNMPGGS